MSAARAIPETWTERDGLLWSPLLASRGLVAGFTTRSFGSLGGQTTAPDAARRARDALARHLGFPALVRVRQVHGDRALYAAAPFDPPWPEADALWTDRPGVLLGVAAADCVPLLIADPEGRVGAAHAGWAGTSLRVARRLVEAMGGDPSRLAASLGPSIGPCCYTVDHDRAAVIRERLGDGALEVAPGGQTVFDLWRANAEQLRESGVGEIEVSGICTRSGPHDVWSYRARERLGLGLGIGFIGMPVVAG